MASKTPRNGRRATGNHVPIHRRECSNASFCQRRRRRHDHQLYSSDRRRRKVSLALPHPTDALYRRSALLISHTHSSDISHRQRGPWDGDGTPRFRIQGSLPQRCDVPNRGQDTDSRKFRCRLWCDKRRVIHSRLPFRPSPADRLFLGALRIGKRSICARDRGHVCTHTEDMSW